MGVPNEYFTQEISVDELVREHPEYLTQQFSTLKGRIINALKASRTQFHARDEQEFLGAQVRGCTGKEYYAVDFHREPVGLKGWALYLTLAHSYRNVSVSFSPTQQQIDYRRIWNARSGRRFEVMSVENFIDQIYQKAKNGLLTRRQRAIITTIEQGNELLKQ